MTVMVAGLDFRIRLVFDVAIWDIPWTMFAGMPLIIEIRVQTEGYSMCQVCQFSP